MQKVGSTMMYPFHCISSVVKKVMAFVIGVFSSIAELIVPTEKKAAKVQTPPADPEVGAKDGEETTGQAEATSSIFGGMFGGSSQTSAEKKDGEGKK